MSTPDTAFLPLPDEAPTTSIILRQALQAPSSRRIWEAYLPQEGKQQGEDLAIRAIARALSTHENHYYGLNSSPHKYKDRIWRALTKGTLSLETINLIKDAFDLDEQTVEALTAQLISIPKVSGQVNGSIVKRQVAPITSFYTFSPSSEPGWYRTEATLTLSALDSGCSSVTFYQPEAKDFSLRDPEYFTLEPQEANTWSIIPRHPYAPLQIFVLRVSFLLRIGQAADGSGRPAIRSPFYVRAPHISVSFHTPPEEGTQQVHFTSYPLSQEHLPTRIKTVSTNDFCSAHFPALKDQNLEISWEPAP